MEREQDNTIRDLIKSLRSIDYIKPNEIPNIDLYMDQLTTFMEQHLDGSKRYDDDKLLTKTMINNYTKNELLPSPDKKKYTKNHLYLLIFIYHMKNFLSIKDIRSVLKPLTQMFFASDSKVKLEDIYEEIFAIETEQSYAIAKDLVNKRKRSKESFSNLPCTEEEKEFLQTFSFVCMLCFDVYMKKQVIEKLIDDHEFFHQEKKKPKEKDGEKPKKKE